MILSDRTIRDEVAAGRIVIEPFEVDHVQPASIDGRRGGQFRVMRNSRVSHTAPAAHDTRQPGGATRGHAPSAAPERIAMYTATVTTTATNHRVRRALST